MKGKHDKSIFHEFSVLTPWETDVQDPSINKYCSDYVSKFNIHTQVRKDNNLPRINPKKRTASHCNTHAKPQPIFQHQKTDYSKTHYNYADNYQQTFHTLSQHRTDRVQKKKPESRGPLQELSVKNFIIQGGQSSTNQKQKQRKRESPYIMKQKFTQFRRSLKTIEQNKENAHVRVIRYQC